MKTQKSDNSRGRLFRGLWALGLGWPAARAGQHSPGVTLSLFNHIIPLLEQSVKQ